MSDDLISQHKRMAMGEGPGVSSIESPFAQVNGSDIPRGEMKDSRRRAGAKGEYANDKDGDYD